MQSALQILRSFETGTLFNFTLAPCYETSYLGKKGEILSRILFVKDIHQKNYIIIKHIQTSFPKQSIITTVLAITLC